MKKEFKYVVPQVDESQFPYIPKEEGARICCEIHPNVEVQLIGNSKGLIYLAKYLVAMALLENREGMHVHLDPEFDQLDAGCMLTICNLDFGPFDP